MTTRSPSHAGWWYKSDQSKLSSELDDWLAEVVKGSKEETLPIQSARVIIAPHAGFEYSGSTAAWAYKYLDLSNAKRVFLLGPSHKLGLNRCALSTHSGYATVFGDLTLDRNVIEALQATKKFATWDTKSEDQEHSLEMHLPFIYKMISLQFKSDAEYPTLIPILVGDTSKATERLYGTILAPYLADPTSVFIVSSDFCHWGESYGYTTFLPDLTSDPLPYPPFYAIGPPIHESIGRLDKLSMDAIESGKHQNFLDNIKKTRNSVCGRHPIGVIMATIEVLEQEGKTSTKETGRFKFIQYKRSADVEDVGDSSVSYASAIAVL